MHPSINGTSSLPLKHPHQPPPAPALHLLPVPPDQHRPPLVEPVLQMPHLAERDLGRGAPVESERRRGAPDEVVRPVRCGYGGGGGGCHAGVALEGAAVVDGEEEDDVAAGVVGVGEDGEVFLLGGPGAVTLCDFHILNVPTFDHEVSGI